ncbi:MAG: ATP-dependent helicase [bacterium]|nr:ATP-dependent helicase [bacterium]
MTNDNEVELLEQLNPDQREAVLYFDSPLLVIAGAGSGKTKVITNKIAYLVKEKDMSPRNILGVTFTNKAAQEMRNRIQSLTGIEARNFTISTFHSLGLRILRESGTASGFDADWQVIDDQDRKKIVERVIKENFHHFTSDMRDTVRRKIGFAKMDLNYPNNKEFLYQKGFNEDEVRIFSLYFKFQRENKLWDYEDLVSLPVKLLRTNEDIREKYARRFRYVVVDEFQDTNPNQYELLTLIAGDHKNITIVGDDDQAVYSWRGASIRFLFNFEDDFPGTHIVKLERNYRSTPQILDFANHLISKNSIRRSKSMWTEEKPGSPVYTLQTRSKEDEASKVATLISRLQEEKPELFPLAVLYRINSQSLAFETEFARRNIPFKILKGLRFFDRKEIRDSMALLKLTIQLNDEISFLRLVDFLPLGIGAKTIDTLTTIARGNQISLFMALKEHAPDKFSSRDIFSAIYKLHHEYREGKVTMADILTRLLRVSGYREILETKAQQDRVLNIEELIQFINNWETTNPGESFARLLDNINLDGSDGGENENLKTPVFLLTMHNAKGLEFPTVVAAGINSSYMPFFLVKETRELEEERRLFYVASTRAIKQLVISTGSERPSRFLSTIRSSFYSNAYSVEDILEHWVPQSRIGPGGLLQQLRETQSAEEKFIDHPIFGRGKIVNDIGNDKYIIDFVDRGEKTIDTSIVPVTFL